MKHFYDNGSNEARLAFRIFIICHHIYNYFLQMYNYSDNNTNPTPLP